MKDLCTSRHGWNHGRRKRGDGGTRPPQSKNQRGDIPPEIMISVSFFLTHGNFAFSAIFKIKWPKSKQKPNFGGRWVLVPMDPSPQTKLSGDAAGWNWRIGSGVGVARGQFDVLSLWPAMKRG